MIISKKAIPRRTILRGLGTTLALPLLDSMGWADAKTKASKPPVRLGFMYMPHGVIMDQWTPAKEGAGFEFTPILKPLEPLRDSLVVVSNLARPEAGFETQHAGAAASWLARACCASPRSSPASARAGSEASKGTHSLVSLSRFTLSAALS